MMMRKITFGILTLITFITTTKSSKYVAGFTEMSFNDAKAFCSSIGSSLASVHSQIDRDALLELCSEIAASVSSNPGNCWFGLTGYPTFSWLDGSTTDYGFNGNSGGSPTYANPPWANNLRDSRYPCTMIWYGKWWNPKADCNWKGLPICNAAGAHVVNGWSGTHYLGVGLDKFTHFRQCEGTTATYGCTEGVLHLGGCWYGSPVDDPGYALCPHPANGFCRPVTGNCIGYIQGQCENKKQCTITISNGNMGGDPCPNTYKFGAIAMQCVIR